MADLCDTCDGRAVDGVEVRQDEDGPVVGHQIDGHQLFFGQDDQAGVNLRNRFGLN
jgi:hypothetical protein